MLKCEKVLTLLLSVLYFWLVKAVKFKKTLQSSMYMNPYNSDANSPAFLPHLPLSCFGT